MGKAFLHIDLDAFFASVEELDHPEYRGKALLIGYNGPRSVVSTCSYEARKFGCHSAMPMSQALRLCPHALVINGNMKRYSQKSREVMNVIKSFAPGFLQVSIDEAFLDISDMEQIYGLPGKAARRLKEKILEETGLHVSVGVASSRFLAKLASDYHKPDGITIVPPSREIEFVDKVGLEKLWGVGEATLSRLRKKGINTVAELRNTPIELLVRMFGEKSALFLSSIANAKDPGIYQGEAKSHSISSENTYWPDVYDIYALETFLFEMAEDLSLRALEEKVIPRTVAIKIRYGDFTTVSAQVTPERNIYSSNDIFDLARRLLREKYDNEGVRLLGLTLAQTYRSEEVEQPDLFSEKEEKERKIEKIVLSLRKSGSNLTRARLLTNEAEVDDDHEG